MQRLHLERETLYGIQFVADLGRWCWGWGESTVDDLLPALSLMSIHREP